ncbi:MAG: pyridoxamine 5'-phosphate oxidase, partial [Verrucomicrobiae bacterium]|nr:pyridoxamine 5'-phosphate oxidase [Verrucomicrobiae bacterium]
MPEQTPNPRDQRRSYERGALSRENLDPDPVVQFRAWFTDATETPEVIEPNAMTLSTVDVEGQPNSRTVLLKAFDERGFVFFTNYESRKAAEIAANPKVALLFPWIALERQAKIQGTAEKISRTETVKYFLSRPVGHRLGAWVSNQSSVVSSKSLLLTKLDEMKRKFADGEVPLPSFWGGYRVRPRLFEFWQ